MRTASSWVRTALLEEVALRLVKPLAAPSHVANAVEDEILGQGAGRELQALDVGSPRFFLTLCPLALLPAQPLVDLGPDGIIQHRQVRAALWDLEDK